MGKLDRLEGVYDTLVDTINIFHKDVVDGEFEFLQNAWMSMSSPVVFRFGRGFGNRGRDRFIDLSEGSRVKHGMLADVSRYAIGAYHKL